MSYNHQFAQKIAYFNPRYQFDCCLFCLQCLKQFFLGTIAFYFYLLIGLGIGITAIYHLQTSEFSNIGELKHMIYGTGFVVYIMSQGFAVLAIKTENEKWFLPYKVILAMIIFYIVIYLLSYYCSLLKIRDDFNSFMLIFLFFNFLCRASIAYHCSYWEKNRTMESSGYGSLVIEEQPVTVNLDNPPKYSSLLASSTSDDPPSYSQLKNYEEMRNSTEKSLL